MNKSLFFAFCMLTILSYSSVNAQKIDLDSLFTDLSEVPGIAVAVYKDGSYVYNNTFGLSNLDYHIPIDDETVFEVGGLAMHITASCILKLEDDGKLKLTDPVSQYLSDFPDFKEGAVTIQHLLHHTSGMMDYLVALDMSGGSWDKTFSSDDAYNLAIKSPKLGFEPGKEYEFSHSNYVVLKKLIEHVSDESINVYASENIFKPLGMLNTFYFVDAKKVVKNRAMAYSKVEEEYKLNHYHNFTSAGDGRLYTSLSDLMIWAESIGRERHPIKNLEERLTQRGVLTNGSKIAYALGLDHGVEKGYGFYGHSGFWAGFTAGFLKVPEEDFWVITLSNNETISAPGMAYRILDLVVKNNPVKTPMIKAHRMSKKDLMKYTGDYITYKNGYLREVLVRNDTLFYKTLSGGEFGLKPIAKDFFKVLGTVADFSVKFNMVKGQLKEMVFMANGIPGYTYTEYTPLANQEIDVTKFLGVYTNSALDITYELKKEDQQNTIGIYVQGEKIMNYQMTMTDLFCSESTHHGYLRFNKDQTAFTLSDYSFKPINFEKKVG